MLALRSQAPSKEESHAIPSLVSRLPLLSSVLSFICYINKYIYIFINKMHC